MGFLIAAGAEGFFSCARQNYGIDRAFLIRLLKRVDELLDRLQTKRVQHIGPIDGDAYRVLAHVVGNVSVSCHGVSGLLLGSQPCMVRPPETLIVWPVMKAASSLARNATSPG